MPHCRVRGYPIAIVGLLLLSAMAMQGCLAAVWLGAVVIDVTRTSDIAFQSFENSCVVAPEEERKHLASVKNIAVMPGLVLPRNEWGRGYGPVVDIQGSRGRVMSDDKRHVDLRTVDLRVHSTRLRYDSDVRIDVWNLSLGLRPIVHIGMGSNFITCENDPAASSSLEVRSRLGG
jgi:hypothetical protein